MNYITLSEEVEELRRAQKYLLDDGINYALVSSMTSSELMEAYSRSDDRFEYECYMDFMAQKYFFG